MSGGFRIVSDTLVLRRNSNNSFLLLCHVVGWRGVEPLDQHVLSVTTMEHITKTIDKILEHLSPTYVLMKLRLFTRLCLYAVGQKCTLYFHNNFVKATQFEYF